MRRKTTAIPSPVAVRGRARIRLDGRTFYLGAVGSPEARRLEDRIVGAWLANGRRLPDDFDPRATTNSSVAPEAAAATPVAAATVSPRPAPLPPAPALGPEAAGGELTVGELCQRWLAWIKAERLTPGQDTSILHGAKQATYALRRHWAMRAGDFGPRALAEVRAALANEPIRVVNRKRKAKAVTATPSKRAKPKPQKPPKPPRYRARSTVVDTVGRVRQLFRWAVSRELVAPDRVHALASLEALLPGQTKAVEREPVKAVSDDVFNATLGKLPPIMADLLRVCRLTGSRPGEVCRMIVRHIDMRGEVWTYAPPKHKNAWRGHSRNVEIGPRAQAILRRYIGNRSIDAPLFSPRESEELRGRKPGRHHRDHYDDCQVCRAVTRACEKHGIQRWTPYQLRHSRLEEVREAFSLDHAQAVGGQKHVRVAEIYAPVKRSKAQEVAKLTG